MFFGFKTQLKIIQTYMVQYEKSLAAKTTQQSLLYKINRYNRNEGLITYSVYYVIA